MTLVYLAVSSIKPETSQGAETVALLFSVMPME